VSRRQDLRVAPRATALPKGYRRHRANDLNERVAAQVTCLI